ncbi:DNA repair-scaffolding protein-like [Lineus longissimus]|uniref:DNA repair-scaffolding protein-like n=1 Tax=Lineus longissimus TaxID=88925 RepID=UPI00315D5C8C
MSKKLFVDSGRKRRLSYNDDEFVTLNQYESSEKKKVRPTVKKRYSIQHQADWNRCMEGFSDFTPKDVVKKRCLQKTDHRNSDRKIVKCPLPAASSVARQESYRSGVPKLQPSRNDPNSSLEICDWSSGSDEEASARISPASKHQPSPHPVSSTELLKGALDESAKKTKELEEDEILTYNSGEEDVSVSVEDDKNRKTDQGTESHSPDVSITYSDPSQIINKCDDAGNAANGIKGSDWLKKLTEITPEKCSTEDAPTDHEDSTKKKRKKYVKFGFVEHLQRLHTREKSAFTFWSHKKQAAQQDISSKTLSLHILSCQTAYSLVSTTALEIRDSQDQMESSCPIQVLFSKSRAQQLQLEAGCEVKIQPPWQTLDLCNSGRVILCTNFCSISSRKDVPVTRVESPSVKRILLYSWTCHCQQEPMIDPVSCPGEVVRTKRTNSGIDHQGDNNPKSSTDALIPFNRGLQCVNATQLPKVNRSILDSIEVQGGGTMYASVAFTAVVQRTVCRRQFISDDGNSNLLTQKGKLQKTEFRWSLLLQDVFGAICEVSIPDGSQHPWADVIKNGEGALFTFHNLLIHQRTNREKMPSLFSMIDSLWMTDKFQLHITSQEDSTQESSAPATPPSFCYVLTAIQATAQVQSSQHSMFTEPKVTSLADVKQLQKSKRITFEAKVIYLQNGKTGGDTFNLYVTDPTISQQSVSSSYVRIQVQPTCGFHLISDKNIFMQKSLVLVFKDIWLHNGNYLADAYSRMSCANDLKWSQLAIQVPKPAGIFNFGMLVSLQGKIQEVDEESAYSWPVCNICGNEKLTYQSKTLGMLYCGECCGPVHSPVNRLRLDIFLETPDIAPDLYKIKIQLLQSSIEMLLPEEADEEGYDIQCVLDKEIGPINCITTSVLRNKLLKKKVIHLTEIELWS